MASRSLGTLTIDLVAKTFGFDQGMDRSARAFDKRVKELERTAKKFGAAIGSALAIGVTAAGAALAKITTDAVNYADQLDELSNRLGVSTEQLSAWGYAAKLTGSDLESLASAIPKLSKNLAAAMDEGSKQAELFKALGIEVTDAAGNLRDVEDVLPQVADRFKQLDNDTTEAALAMELFGKSGPEFLEFLNQGSDGLQAMAKEALDLGAILGEDTTSQAALFKDQLEKLDAAATGLGTQIASGLLPVAQKLLVEFTAWIKQGDLARNVTTLLTTAVDAGVGALNLYQAAVDNVSVAIEQAVKSYEGWAEATRNIGTFGFADGSVVEGFRKIGQAADDAAAERKFLSDRRNARAPIPGVDELDPTLPAPLTPQERAGLNGRVNGFLAGNAERKARATKATKELTEAEKAWQDVMEVNALIDEQVQDYRSQQIADAYELEKAREAAVKRVDEQIADMQHEYELLGLTNRERAQEIELRYAGAEATEEQRQKISELAGAIYDQNEALDRQVEIMDAGRDTLGSFFGDLKDGVGPVDALTNALDRLLDKLYDIAVDGIIDQLFGQQGSATGGSAGGWFSAIAGFFGGGKATGGWTLPNTMYEVNERGMEMATVRGRDYLLTGSSPAQITPSHRLGMGGGGMNVTQVINNPQFTDPRSQSQILQRSAEKLRIAAVRNS